MKRPTTTLAKMRAARWLNREGLRGGKDADLVDSLATELDRVAVPTRKALRISPELHRRLRIVAAVDGVKIRDATNTAIMEYVESHERKP